ncbi:MAG: Nif3-like dinuclear metal center hexameric protein [Thermodesulfobacteriota bacterium]
MNGVPLSRIIEMADELFPFSLAEPWDNSGLQIGDPDKLVQRLAVSLDPTPHTLAFAQTMQCQLLITHHPVLIQPVSRIVKGDYVGRIVMAAATSGVDVLALHTNLDAAPGGLNDALAHMLGLEEVVTPESAPCARLGHLPEPLPIEALAEKVRDDLHVDRVTIVHSSDRSHTVQSVFCVSGSGMSYLREALNMRADVIVTGDVRYHSAVEARDMGIAVIDAGHYGLEQHAVELLCSTFKRTFAQRGWTLDVFPCNSETSPFCDTMGSFRRETK